MDLIKKIQDAGVVGAGGAGFPSHAKLNSRVEYFIVNGAECEPLLCKDKEMMRLFAPEISSGINLVRTQVGASNTVVGIKTRNKPAVAAMRENLDRAVRLHLMNDIYPAGDEFVLVYEATGRLIPAGGIPLEIGCVVSNVETLYNLGFAANDMPVVDKFITVSGAVKKPVTVKVPIGTSIGDCLGLAGGPAVKEFSVLSGGAMMGELADPSAPITKTTAGFIVLPKSHQQVARRSLTQTAVRRVGASACDQCYRCTELCPRWLLGYDIQPHAVMRSLGFAADFGEQFSRHSLLCCECNICSLYACPEDLDPKNICAWSKRELHAQNIFPDKRRHIQTHPMRSGRQVPTALLTRRLGLATYDVDAPFQPTDFVPDRVKIPLRQHIGVAADPAVRTGERVRRGDLIGQVAPDKLGANVHASIDGTIESIAGDTITIRRQ